LIGKDTVYGGRRVVKTVCLRITAFRPASGYNAETE
jgi:hypothetical protein